MTKPFWRALIGLAAAIALERGYFKEQGIEATDIDRQIAWDKSQNLLTGEVKAAALIDSRYAMPAIANK